MSTSQRPATASRAAPLRVLELAGRILTGTCRGLLRCWWQLLGLTALSFVLHHLLIDLGARIAIDNGPAGMALLVLAIAVRLVLIAIMVLVAANHIHLDGRPLSTIDLLDFLRDPERADGGDNTPRLRDQLEMVVTALGPLVLLYAGWQLINNDLHQFLIRLFANSLESMEVTNNSNINFDQGWKAYIAWAVGIWLAKVVLERVRSRFDRRFLDIPIIYAEVGWIVLAWLVVTSLLGRLRSWWRAREFVSWWREAVQLLDAVITLPGFDLPAVITTVAGALSALLSLLFHQLAQPIIWIAVVGLVLGWGRSESSLVHGSWIEEGARRRWSGTARSRRLAQDAATRGLREKYVPVLAILRLTWRAGLLPILTIGALYTIGGLLTGWVETWVLAQFDARGEFGQPTAETVQRSVRFLLEPVRVCFLVAAFAEILRLRAGRPAPGQRLNR